MEMVSEVDMKQYTSVEITWKFIEAIVVAGILDYYTENCQSTGQLEHLSTVKVRWIFSPSSCYVAGL